MTVLGGVLRYGLFTVFALALIRLRAVRKWLIVCVFSERTENLPAPFLASLFSPTLRVPALMLEDDAVNGSGAASLESF